jgi:molybdopterin converting factor small subunit
MPNVVLPNTLTELFPGIPRRVELTAAGDGASCTVQDVVAQLDAQFPGMRNRICDLQGAATTIRRHLLIFVDDERSDLTTPVSDRSEVRIVPALSGG